ncbi:MAG: lysozyme, partial [Brevundimonas sp.]
MSDATTPRLKVSREGIVLIKSFEGFRPHAVRGGDGRWIIGYGHTASAREGLSVGEQDAELLLQYDLLPVVRALNERAPATLNQHQFDALASFAISVGVERFLASDVLQRLNEGRAGLAADALIGWPEAASLESRLRRRAAERALFVADPASAVTLADLLAAPLPPAPTEPHSDASGARAAAVAALLGETPGHEATPGAVNPERFSPYAAAIVGPLPGFERAEPAVAEAEPASGTTGDPDQAPVVPLASPAPTISPFPAMDQSLILTPLTEADMVPDEPQVEPGETPAAPPAEQETVLFDD